MSLSGTDAYDGLDLPPLVRSAVAAARAAGFANSCLPAQGRLLQVLAAGATAIGETGTGCGVGLAWLRTGAAPGARLVSIERDASRSAIASTVFACDPSIRVRHGDWPDLHADGPFDLLVLDGGGQGKGAQAPLDPAGWLTLGGIVVIDDFTPLASWPPTLDGAVDAARLYWLDHPMLRTTEVRLTPAAATLVGTYIGAV